MHKFSGWAVRAERSGSLLPAWSDAPVSRWAHARPCFLSLFYNTCILENKTYLLTNLYTDFYTNHKISRAKRRPPARSERGDAVWSSIFAGGLPPFGPLFKVLGIGRPDLRRVDLIAVQVLLHQVSRPLGVPLLNAADQIFVVFHNLLVLHRGQGHAPHPVEVDGDALEQGIDLGLPGDVKQDAVELVVQLQQVFGVVGPSHSPAAPPRTPLRCA